MARKEASRMSSPGQGNRTISIQASGSPSPSSSMVVDYSDAVAYHHHRDSGVPSARSAVEPRKLFPTPNDSHMLSKPRRHPLDPTIAHSAYTTHQRDHMPANNTDANDILQQRAEDARRKRHRVEDELGAPSRAVSFHPSGASSWQYGHSGSAAHPHHEATRPRQSILAALNQSQDLVIKLIEENHQLRKRLEVAITEIHRVRAFFSKSRIPTNAPRHVYLPPRRANPRPH